MKDILYWKILSAALELDFLKGHLKWTLSEIARKTNVTRSLIYYYFGPSKEDILHEAIRLVGSEIVGTSQERRALWDEGQFFESVLLARQVSQRVPFLSGFIAKHMDAKTAVGQRVRYQIESFREKLSRFFPKLTPEEVKGIHSLYWGMIFVPGIREADLQSVFQLIEQILYQKPFPLTAVSN